jgi:hypothetical protein
MDPGRRRGVWRELERFRSARAFGQAGCLIAVILAAGLVLKLL